MEDLTDFVVLVRTYTDLIETAADLTDVMLCTACARLLPQLDAWGTRLPATSPPDLDDDPPPALATTRPLFARFGQHASYRQVFDPLEDAAPVTAMRADDLADIYHDLKRPLLRFDGDDPVAQQLAIWEWRTTLRGHAGQHIVNVLRPIHMLLQADLLLDDTAHVSDPGDTAADRTHADLGGRSNTLL